MAAYPSEIRKGTDIFSASRMQNFLMLDLVECIVTIKPYKFNHIGEVNKRIFIFMRVCTLVLRNDQFGSSVQLKKFVTFCVGLFISS
jgi:hypothetical protein